MNNLSDALAWPTRDPQWISKILLMGLIGLIPIVGGMVIYGWLLACMDNVRSGRQELPPAGFQYFNRGVMLWVVLLLWGLAAAVVIGVVFIIGAALASTGSSANSGALSAIGLLFILLGYLVTFVVILAIYFLEVPIILATDRGGIGGGLNVGAIIGMATSNPGVTLLAGLMVLVAGVIASLGTIVCFVGVIFTSAYSYAVIGAVAAHYERSLAQAPVPPTAPAV